MHALVSETSAVPSRRQSAAFDLPTATLDVHLNRCSRCRSRWEQAVALDRFHKESYESSAGPESYLPNHTVSYTSLLSPIGMLWIAVSCEGLLLVDSSMDEAQFCSSIENRCRVEVEGSTKAKILAVAKQFEEYFEGRRKVFDVPIDLSGLSEFQRTVLKEVCAVPYGETRSYAEIARSIGRPQATRAVGAAVATNPISIVVPCHRIVRSDGSPGEYALRTLGVCGRQYKLALLALEGITL
jgi:methylated-DNA-[protein]-cysteine S-methyltransferase